MENIPENKAGFWENPVSLRYLQLVLKPNIVASLVEAARSKRITEEEFADVVEDARGIYDIPFGLSPGTVDTHWQRIRETLKRVGILERAE